MALPSPNCNVNGAAPPQDVAASSSVAYALVNAAGAVQWFIGITACDDSSTLATLHASLSIDQTHHTATSTSAGAGSCFQVTSTVSAHPTKGSLGFGYDINGVLQPGFTTTFKVNVKAANGLRVLFAGELAEQDPVNSGGVLEINAVIRALAGIAGSAFDLMMDGNDADVTVTSTTQNVTVVMRNMTANRNVNLPTPTAGQRVTVKARHDGSLGVHNVIVNSSGGATIDNSASPFTMTPGTYGDGGSASFTGSATLTEWERT